MRLHRSGSIQHLLPSLVVTAVLSLLLPISSHATVFWDDELESGNTGYNFSSLTGIFVFDTSVKFSGTGSIRLDYPPVCEPRTAGGSGCGGYTDRVFTPTSTMYRRVYFRMSSGFATSMDTFTKMFRSDTSGPNSNWWTMGQGNGYVGGKTFNVGVQNSPTIGQTKVYWSSIMFSDAQWYCIETMEQLNTPGVANGIVRAWVDGVQVMNATDVIYRQAGDNSLFQNHRLFRQTGVGSIWYDHVAVGDTRIGCSGSSTTTGDTTPPASPTGLVVR